MDAPTVKLSRKGATRVAKGHLWVFASDIEAQDPASPGDVVQVLDSRSQPIAIGHFSSTSQIRVRILDRKPRPVDADFFRERLQAAIQHRQRVVTNSDAYRLVHSEGDLLPGLIVDRFGDYLSCQFLTQGMDRATPVLLQLLNDLVQPRGIVLRNDPAVREKEGLPRETKVEGNVPDTLSFRMNGLQFQTSLQEGQKTGGFLDQRENYLAASRYAWGSALDCFTNAGGFALHLASSCERVEAVDASKKALQGAARNGEANEITNLSFREADAFDLLKSFTTSKRHFDTIVLDPPAFTKAKGTQDRALSAYLEINQRAMRMLSPGGILVTCSCSQHVSPDQFVEVIHEAAVQSLRRIRILERRTQAQDHPVLLGHPESEYLKCLILEVL